MSAKDFTSLTRDLSSFGNIRREKTIESSSNAPEVAWKISKIFSISFVHGHNKIVRMAYWDEGKV